MRIAAAQINVTVGDLEGNRARIAESLRRAKAREADMVVFPELAICGYPPEDLLLKDHFVRDNIKVLRSLASETKGIVAVVGFADTDGKGRLYNAAAIIGDGRVKSVYRKEALPNYGVFDEKRYFCSGRRNKNFVLDGVQVGVSICEDMWVEKGPWLRQARRGAKLLINLSSSPYEVGKLKEREKLLRKRAAQTKSFVCYVNLVGGQDELVFDGSSMVFDSAGKMIASGKQFEEDLVIVDLPIGRLKQKRPIENRCAASFSQDERIYRALVLGTRDYAKKNGFQKAVLGLSGGIDSALVAAVATDALGKENVIGVTMPSRYTSQGTKKDARKLAGNLGIRLIEAPIEKMFKVYLNELKGLWRGTKAGLAEENLQARIRGNILMALSNKFGWLVLTTGNKSEVAVGYCTLYGDMTGGFAVIKDVPKTKIYDLARLKNAREGNMIPASILKRAPTAELKAHQKDQDSLPPYGLLDEMLKEYVEHRWPLAKMARRRDRALIKNIIGMVDRSEYKRRQAPPGIKITPRAFGKDWRLPITNCYKER